MPSLLFDSPSEEWWLHVVAAEVVPDVAGGRTEQRLVGGDGDVSQR